jgi:diacylglycerol kinase (ATP)
MLALERLQFVNQLVIFGITDLWCVFDIVEMFVTANLFAQLFDGLCGVVHGWLSALGRYNKRITPYRRPFLIYNPVSGKFRRNPERILQRTIAALEQASLRPELLPTREPGDGTQRAREAISAGADLILSLGGDGTINEIVNGIACRNVPVGILPGGTANCLAMELGLGSNVERAVSRLTRCAPRQVALGRITAGDPRLFLLMCGAGLDGRIVYDLNPAWKQATGKLAYWMAGLRQLAHSVEQLEVRVDGKLSQRGFVLASRIRNYGGDLEIARGASLARDDFEVVLFTGSNPIRYLAYMLSVGLKMVQKMPGVQTIRARRVEIISGAHLQVDGEYVGHQPAVLETVPKALSLLMPPQYG